MQLIDKKSNLWAVVGLLLASTAVSVSCGGGKKSQNLSVTPALPQAQGEVTQVSAQGGAPALDPFIEAQIEFAGPDSKWMGPAPLLMSVRVKEGQATAQAEFSPKLFSSVSVESQAARDRLSELASIAQESNAEEAGCQYPIRIKLIRQGGQTLDRTSCRGQKGLGLLTSAFVGLFMAPVVEGSGGRLPAGHATENGLHSPPTVAPIHVEAPGSAAVVLPASTRTSGADSMSPPHRPGSEHNSH